MGSNISLYEKAHREHDHDLQYKIAEKRRLSHLPQHRVSRSRRVAVRAELHLPTAAVN